MVIVRLDTEDKSNRSSARDIRRAGYFGIGLAIQAKEDFFQLSNESFGPRPHYVIEKGGSPGSLRVHQQTRIRRRYLWRIEPRYGIEDWDSDWVEGFDFGGYQCNVICVEQG